MYNAKMAIGGVQELHQAKTILEYHPILFL
jgi:hypothetical protein